jgi:dihydroxy-acid dehydratase
VAARDLVTNDIEAQVEAAVLDGMICLTSCDKTPPGHLMAATGATCSRCRPERC